MYIVMLKYVLSSSPFIFKVSAFFHAKLGLDNCLRVSNQPLVTLYKS